jgi:4-amino-4-deoxy-L-arabinose transferase-like glycosyltransferase
MSIFSNFNTSNKKILLFWGLVILMLSVVVNSIALCSLGSRLEPDSVGYIRVAKNFIEYGSLLENDYESGVLVPFTERTPGYPLFLAGIYKLFGGSKSITTIIATFQVLFLAASSLLVFILGMYAFGERVGVVSGLFAAADPWASLAGIMILPDSLFYFATTLSILIGVYTLKSNNSTKWIKAFLWGVSIGFSSMFRSVISYFWLITLPIFIYNSSIRRATVFFILFMMGIILFTGGWAYRNYKTTGFWGLQSATGVSLLWASHNLTRPSTANDYKIDPKLAKVRDMVASGTNPMKLMTPIRKELNLSPFGLDECMKKVGIENILENPVKFSRIFFKNYVKIITTLFNADHKEGGTVYSFSPIVVWAEKLSSFIIFLLLPIAGFMISWHDNHNRSVLLFFAGTVFYFLITTSLVAGSFRYRLPLHAIFWTLDAVVLLALFDKLTVPFKSGKLSLLFNKGK